MNQEDPLIYTGIYDYLCYHCLNVVRLRHPLKGNELSALQKLQPHFSLKCVDAYDDSAVILKWSGQDLQVSHDDMAQYAFLGGKFSSELESFSGGMSGPGGGGGTPHMKGVGMLGGNFELNP